MIRETIDKDSKIVCDILMYSFATLMANDKNFDFIKQRELKFLETMFNGTDGYYVFNLDEFAYRSGFNKINTYYDYAIRNSYPNKKLYENLNTWRDDLPYKNRWALIFGSWEYYNCLKEITKYSDIIVSSQCTTITLKLDSIKNYLPKPHLEKYHNCGNPEKCPYKEFSIQFRNLTDKDPNQWIAIGQNIGSGTLLTYLDNDFEKYKNEVIVTLSKLSRDAKILFLSRFIKENGKSDEDDRKILVFLNDELNKCILENNPSLTNENIPAKKIAFKHLVGALKLIALKTDEIPELKNPQNTDAALCTIYKNLNGNSKLKWHTKSTLGNFQKEWKIFDIRNPSKLFCSKIIKNKTLKDYPELEEWIKTKL